MAEADSPQPDSVAGSPAPAPAVSDATAAESATAGPVSRDLDAITSAVFAAAEAGDWERFASYFAPDAVLKQNVGPAQTIAQAKVTLPRLVGDGTTLRYENVRRLLGPDWVTEMHDAVFIRDDGREVRLDICVVLQFDGAGKITRTDEYVDSAAAAALFES